MTEKIEPKSKQELLELIRVERSRLDAVIEKLSEAQLLTPGFEGKRCVKDLIAHITAWEQRMVQWVTESYSGIVPQRPAPDLTWNDLDRLNEQTWLENKDKGLSEVMSAASTSFAQVWKIVEGMTDADLFEGSRFAWRDGDPMWHMIAANTWWHYQEHREQIATWLAGSA